MVAKVPASFRLLRCRCGFLLLLLLVVVVVGGGVTAAAGTAPAFVVGEDPTRRACFFPPTGPRSSPCKSGAPSHRSACWLSRLAHNPQQQFATAPEEGRPAPSGVSTAASSSDRASCGCGTTTTTRRGAIARGVATAAAASGFLLGIFPASPSLAAAAAAAADDTLEGSRARLLEAQQQLNPIPDYIKAEKWDLVRAALLQRPLNDLWSKASSNVVSTYAQRVGDAGGDELEALELRESLSSHLRYLDMAVYNNVFNPISTQGTIGASADLVKSYYDDPTNEYKASLQALQELIALSDRLVP
jgi:hypothetical protein